jgi:hypothetical protein
MRTVLSVTIDTEVGNKAIADGENGGTLARVIQDTLDELKPEAAYFYTEDGNRHGIIVFELDDQTRIPSIAEPLFQQLGAKVSFSPVMNADDLQHGLQTLDERQGAGRSTRI